MCIVVGSTYSNFTQDENSAKFLVAVRFRTIPKPPPLFFKQDKQNKEKAVIAQMVEQR